MTSRASAAATAASLVEQAQEMGLQAVKKRDTATGYAGVTKVKRKYQARFYDKVRKKQRALPGLHKTAEDAGLALAAAKVLLGDSSEAGEELPSPEKRKSRRPAAKLQVAMAMPLTAAMPRLPLVMVQPAWDVPPVGMARPMLQPVFGTP